jgi:hypothetical protein
VTPDEALSTIDTDRASIMSAKFYNGRRSFGDLIRNLIQSALSLPEVRTRLVINVTDEKRHALERWGAHVADLARDGRSLNVVRLEARA